MRALVVYESMPRGPASGEPQLRSSRHLRGLPQGHPVTGPWSLCRACIPRCALATEKDPGQTGRNGDRPWVGRAPLTTQSESARSGGGILLGPMSRTGVGARPPHLPGRNVILLG